jgi:hypothetical protein
LDALFFLTVRPSAIPIFDPSHADRYRFALAIIGQAPSESKHEQAC